jgi:hypothetical protein
MNADATNADPDAPDEFQASLDLGQGGLDDGDNEDQKIAANAAARAADEVGKPVEEIAEPVTPDVPEGDLPD